MALCVPSAGLGGFGLAPPDSFPVKGKEGVLLVSLGWRGGSLSPAPAASMQGLPCSPHLFF